MARILSGMQHAMSEMPHCSRGSVDAMHGAVDGMHAAVRGHSRVLEQTDELGAARRECAEHYIEMSSLMTDFDTALHSARCSMMDH
jgi:hypothetical protein